MEFEDLSGLQKTAILMLSLGPDVSAGIFRHMEEEEVESLTTEIVKLGYVPNNVIDEVVSEFYQMILAHNYLQEGGLSYAQRILQEALGENRALEIIKKIKSSLKIKGFNILKNIDPNQLLTFLQKEHPQTIALVLTQLAPTQAASILQDLPSEIQQEVVFRFSRMERVNPDVIRAVEQVLESRIDFSQAASKLGGVKSAAEILNLVGQSTEKAILSGIARQDPDLATEIKNLMFVFEDMIMLDDRSIQKVLKEVDTKELTLALKACSPELKGKILSNMSSRAAEMISEELEFMPPVRLKEVEEVQQKVVDIIRRLEEEGQIFLAKSGADEMI
jgi:flagellar motor switch protein FliG